MKLLFLAPRLPWPASSGGTLRSLHLLEALGRSFETTLLAFGEEGEAAEVLRGKVASLKLLPSPESLLPLSRLLTKTPFRALRYFHKEMTALLFEQRADICHIDHCQMAQYVPLPFLTSIDAHNIESLLVQRMAGRSRGLRRLFLQEEASRWRAYERSTFSIAGRATVCSALDKARLLAHVPSVLVEEIPNGVDVSSFAEAGPSYVAGQIVFVGSLDWAPNVDGLAWFCAEVFPRVRERLPHLSLFVVGRNPTETIVKLGRLPGVVLCKNVSDVRPFLRGALAAVVPLWVGGGTRLKILEAFAARVPVVSTSIGCEGIGAIDRRELRVADDPITFANAICKISEQQEDTRHMIERAFSLVDNKYRWEVIGRRLVSYYQDQLLARASS